MKFYDAWMFGKCYERIDEDFLAPKTYIQWIDIKYIS